MKRKKVYRWETSDEFKEIYERKKKYLDELRNDPLFRKEWRNLIGKAPLIYRHSGEVKKKNKGRLPVMKTMKIKGEPEGAREFCKKWELDYFPRSLSNKEFCPVIGPPLEFEYNDKGKISKMVFNPKGLTQQDIKRYWKILDEYKKLVYGEAERHRPNKWRDLRWCYLYKEITSSGKYRKVAEKTIELYPETVRKSLDMTEDVFKENLKQDITKKDLVEDLIPLIKIAIKREGHRRNK